MKSYVPSRSALPPWEGGVEHVVAQFQEHTSTLASQLVTEYRQVCNHDNGSGHDGDSIEERCANVIIILLCTNSQYLLPAFTVILN